MGPLSAPGDERMPLVWPEKVAVGGPTDQDRRRLTRFMLSTQPTHKPKMCGALCELHGHGFCKRAVYALVGSLIVAWLIGWFNAGEQH
jgi:hypothetical protein